MKYNLDKNKYYSCYSLKMMEELQKCGFEPIESFKNVSTSKHCQVFLMSDELGEFLSEWSLEKQRRLANK